MPTAKSQTLSFVLHVAALALLLLLSTTHTLQTLPVLPVDHIVSIAPLKQLMAKWTGEKSGGGNQTELPARHGAPPPPSHRTFVPPVQISDPKLPMPVTIAVESPVMLIAADQIGDPLSKLPNGGLGIHGMNSIGNAKCCGIGNGTNGPDGISVSRPGHPVTNPVLIYKVEPEFSEEARKSKFSGYVVLAIEVDTNGHTRNFRVIQGAGLGLDQKAIEAVKQWRFRPGYQDGKPVVTAAQVEVTFRLM